MKYWTSRQRMVVSLWGLVGLFLLLQPLSAMAMELVVVARADAQVDKLSKREVADIFLGRRSLSGNLKIYEPLDRLEREQQEFFYRFVADMSLNRLRAYWSKQVFTGRKRPPRIVSALQARDAVRSDPTVITYMLECERPEGTKVLATLADEWQLFAVPPR